MNKAVKKFLEFNGKSIYFLSSNGSYWIAIKPICEALNVDFNRQFKNLKKDKILSEALAVQPMVDAKNSLRNMVALPEFYVYGWLFQIQSSSEPLLRYKWECFRVLYNYFQGSAVQRTNALNEKIEVKRKLSEVQKELSQNTKFIEYQNLMAEQMRIGTKLKILDDEVINQQLSLF